MKRLYRSIFNSLRRRRPSDRSLLVVDDDHDMRAATVLLLQNHEFGPIWEAEDVGTALDMAHEYKPRYIVTDRLFGPQEYPASIAFLKRFLPDSRIVVFSGAEGQPEWADAAVLKPDFAELTRTLNVLEHLAGPSR